MKGNKKGAEALLIETRKNYIEESEQDDLEPVTLLSSNEITKAAEHVESDAPISSKAEIENATEDILISDYMLEWLETVKPSIELIIYISY
ncbi:hypothetical protein FHR92_004958 [Fontibacillus solani]|uniref:Uncharacterized protein n=1 Tax=Fontibacillus solani TaxID=1572857 RepID=A0A7W3XUB6_9BACL|nr:hypothetical protein [Fontibacillus solani]MBA9088459.1 hypothetical protein [Fontibacillus solani]